MKKVTMEVPVETAKLIQHFGINRVTILLDTMKKTKEAGSKDWAKLFAFGEKVTTKHNLLAGAKVGFTKIEYTRRLF